MNNEPPILVTRQLEALSRLIQDERDRQCQEILAKARSEAEAILEAAQRTAKKRIRSATREERARLQQALSTVQARQTTAKRRRQLSETKAMLVQARALLRQEVLRRWQEPTSRRAWVLALREQARTLLPGGPWQVVHPLDWSPEEWSGSDSAQFQADDTVLAGLKIFQGGACLDGTLDGLLADQNTLEAQLLALLAAPPQ